MEFESTKEMWDYAEELGYSVADYEERKRDGDTIIVAYFRDESGRAVLGNTVSEMDSGYRDNPEEVYKKQSKKTGKADCWVVGHQVLFGYQYIADSQKMKGNKNKGRYTFNLEEAKLYSRDKAEQLAGILRSKAGTNWEAMKF